MDPFHRDLLRQAVAAAKEGSLEEARSLVGQVIEEDEENVQAWLLLGRLANSTIDKRMALSTVLQLEPGNSTAQELMSKLDAVSDKDDEDDIIPGVSRRQAVILLGSIAALLVVALVTVIIINNRQSAEVDNERSTEQAINAQGTAIAVRETNFITETQAAIQAVTDAWLTEITRTPTSTATATATSTPTATSTRATALPPAVAFGGTIVGWSPRRITASDNLPLVFFPITSEISAGEFVEGIEGRFTSISADGTRILYTTSVRADTELNMINPAGERLTTGIEQALVTGEVAFGDNMMGSFNPQDSNQYVFIGEAFDNRTNEVYILTLPSSTGPDATLPPEGDTASDSDASQVQALRLTNDPNANYIFPVFSPDGTKVVAVREDITDDNPGFDLVIIDVATRTLQPLTRDRNVLQETHVAWSPNGELIAFSAIAEATPENQHDIYIIAADGSGQPFPIITGTADDIYPVYAPNGAALAFTSDRGIAYNIFIYDVSTQQVSAQVSDRDDETYGGGWVNVLLP